MFNPSSWLAEVATYLHNNTAGVFGNTPTANIFLQQLPDSPVLAIGLFVAGGQGGSDSLFPLERPFLQCLVRRTTNIDGLRYASLVFNLLDNTWNITPSFSGRIIGDASPGAYYISAKGFPVYTLNFSAVLGRQ